MIDFRDLKINIIIGLAEMIKAGKVRFEPAYYMMENGEINLTEVSIVPND